MIQHPVKAMHQIVMMTGSVIPGYTGSEGISTTICVQVAAGYFLPGNNVGDQVYNYVYLIDAMDMNGFATPAQPKDFLYSVFPILKEICEVCFPCSILNSSVVGAVWPEGFPSPPSASPEWPKVIGRLNLAVNPRYESGFAKGLVAAKKWSVYLISDQGSLSSCTVASRAGIFVVMHCQHTCHPWQ